MSQAPAFTALSGTRLTIFGAIAVALGFLALLAPGLAGMSIAMILGVLVLLVGIIRLLSAIGAGGVGKSIWRVATGALTVLCGIVLLTSPLVASGLLAILLAIYFVVDGVTDILAGVQLRGSPDWGWSIFSGVVSVLLGVIIWAQYPLSGIWAMGTLVGIKLFFVGLTMVAGGAALRAASRTWANPAKP